MNYSEKNPSAEILIKREDVLAALLKDIKSPEAQELLQKYTKQRRDEASNGTPEEVNAKRLSAELEISKLYEDAKYPPDKVIESYEGVLIIAEQRRNEEVYNWICSKLDELEKLQAELS